MIFFFFFFCNVYIINFPIVASAQYLELSSKIEPQQNVYGMQYKTK